MMQTAKSFLPEESHKQYKYLHRQACQEEIIRRAYLKMRKGKTHRAEIQYIDEHLDEEIEKMRLVIVNTKPPGVPVEHPELAFRPSHKQPRLVFEGGKWRKIYMPPAYEQWVHHIIIAVLEPIITRSSYGLSCGSMPKRGSSRGKKAIERWIRENPKQSRYFAKCDIRHFYDSIRLEILMRELRVHIKDEWFLYLIELCLSDFNRGVPLGYYISQWLANYLLEPMDRMIVEELGAGIFCRYADDLVIIGPNKKKLHALLRSIRMMLGRRFRLKLKRTYTVAKFDYVKRGRRIGRDIDFMGFRFFRDRTTIRKAIMCAATRKATQIAARVSAGAAVYRKHAAAILSYMGWFEATASYGCYLRWIKPKVKIKTMKRIISKLQRRANEHDRMESGAVRVCA